MIQADAELAKQGSGAFEDVVSLELCDLDRGVFAFLRLTRKTGAERTSALALVCLDGESVATLDQPDLEVRVEAWEDARAAGVRLANLEPLVRWEAGLEDDSVALAVEAEAISVPVDLDDPPAAPLAQAAGIHRYEQLCRVRGELTAPGGRSIAIDGVGRRSHSWGRPANASFRSLFAIAGDRAVTLSAVRREPSEGHDLELVAAYLLQPEQPPEPFEQARLSTVYDAAGRPRTAGIELFMAGDEYPRRVSGEAVCKAAVRALRASSFRWTLEGEPAQGSFQVASIP